MSYDKNMSLTLSNAPLKETSISDIIDMLKAEVRAQSSYLDAGTSAAILDADDDMLDTILMDYDSQLLWNLINSSLGKGILIGFLISSITRYYEDLQLAEEADRTMDGEELTEGPISRLGKKGSSEPIN